MRKYNGARDDKVLEDWITDATRAIRGQADADAVDFLVYHLEGPAKDEVRLRPPTEWATPDDIFKVLRASFGEQLTATQALRKFFGRRQQEKETAQDFAHALMVLQARVERLDPSTAADKEKLLRDQFLDNLRDSTLRREVKRWARDHPEKRFNDVREEVQRWVDEDCTPVRRAGTRETAAVTEEGLACDELRGGQNNQKAISELQNQQEALMVQIKEQGNLLAKQQELLVGLMSQMERKPPGRCYECDSPNHYRNRCPKRRGRSSGQNDKSRDPPKGAPKEGAPGK